MLKQTIVKSHIGSHPKATQKLAPNNPINKTAKAAGILKFLDKNNVGKINIAQKMIEANICPAKVGIPNCVARFVGKSIKSIASLIFSPYSFSGLRFYVFPEKGGGIVDI